MQSPVTRDALTAAGVSKRFGGLVAVDDISFKLAEREVLGLIGPNGSGKTTMMNLISGALKPTSGAISVYGEAVAGTGASNVAKKGIARTFQLVRMLPGMTVLENVAAGGVFGHARRWGKELDDYAYSLLDRVGLPNVASAPVSALTYIDQKRVELARALAADPKILLLDEWLAGLNPTELKIGITLIERLRAEGCTIIVVEHVMHAIRSLCDRCIVMNSGAKIAEGTPAEVLADHGVIRAYLGDENA
jgi:branched-chain amino acid transport system ATP-binding protein